MSPEPGEAVAGGGNVSIRHRSQRSRFDRNCIQHRAPGGHPQQCWSRTRLPGACAVRGARKISHGQVSSPSVAPAMRMLFYIAHKTNNTTLKHRPCSSEATRNRPRCPGAAVLPRSYQTMSPAAHVRVGAAVLREQAVPPFSTAAIIASPPHPNMRQALPRPPIYTKPCNGDLSQRLAEPSKAPLSGCEALKQDDFNVLRKDQCQRHDP